MLHLVGCLYYSNSDARSYKHQTCRDVCHLAKFSTWRYYKYKHRNPVFCDVMLFRWASSSRRFEGTDSASYPRRHGSPTTLLRKRQTLQIQCGLVQNNIFSRSLKADISQTFTTLQHAVHVNLSTQSKLQKYRHTSLLWL